MTDDTDRRALVAKRAAMLRVLADRPWSKPALMDRLGVSRSTVDRAIRELREAGLAASADGSYVASATGRLALARYDAFRTEMADVFDAAPALAGLPHETDVPVAMVTGARVVTATDAAPYRPTERLLEALSAADRYRAVLPGLADARQIRTLHDRVVTSDATAEIVASPSVVDHLEAEYAAQLTTMADTDRFRLHARSLTESATAGEDDRSRAETPLSYGVATVESGDAVTAWLLVYRDDGRIEAVVANDDPEAVDWAQTQYEAHETASTAVTDRFQTDPEPFGSLPIPLQRAGFIELSGSLFADRPVDPPHVAWRAGLGLPEVYAGFAVERTDPASGASLTETVLDTLRGEDHCAVIGPPGIGKSTICKRVACAWYGDEEGPVFYRSAGDGRAPFEAVDELVEIVNDTAGRPLIVVEDAVRPEAARIAAVVDRVDSSAAAVLLDAREEEWTGAPDTERERLLHESVETVRVPTLSDRDRRRLAERVETTLPDAASTLDPDAAVDLDPTDEPDDANGYTPIADETPSMFLHRLVTDAALDDVDAVTTGHQTTLEAEFERLFDDLTDIDGLDAGLTVTLLNAAGGSVGPSHIRAIADDGDRVLDTLGGTVFLETDAGPRTVHHAWSIRFLSWVAEHHPENAAAAIERGVARLIDVGTDPVERATRQIGADDTWLDAAADDPTGWLVSVARRLFRTLRSIPALSPLFESDANRIRLPAALPPETELACRLDRAKAHTDARSWDRASASLARAETRLEAVADVLASSTHAEYRAEIAMARGTLARQRADLETAEEQYQTALEHAEDADSSRQRGRAHNGLGVVAGMHGTVDEAVDQFEAALAASRAAADLVTQSNVLRNLGNVAALRADHETAIGHYEESISLAQRHGLGAALAGRYVSLGEARLHRAAYDAAETAYTRGLQMARRVGAPGPEANAVGGLGELALERGELAEAEERFTRAVELFEGLDQPRWLATAKHKSGKTARRRGDAETALDRLRDALTTAAAVDDARLHAEITTELGLAELADGQLDRAAQRLRQALVSWDDTGLEAPSGRAKRGLAAVAFERGDLATAEREIDEALDRLRESDRQRDVAETRLLAGRIAADRDDPATARDSLSAAVERFREIGADDRAAVAADLLREATAGQEVSDAEPGPQ